MSPRSDAQRADPGGEVHPIEPRASSAAPAVGRDFGRDHPVGTSVGVGAGALAGATVGTAVGGPVGTMAGAAVGALLGGLAGHGVSEMVEPDDSRWWTAFDSLGGYVPGYIYDYCGPAYRLGDGDADGR